jgi:polar amino acid transport system substrate-binding protein
MKRIIFLSSLVAVLAGCVTTTKTVAPDPSILRVGISPRSQPVIYKQEGQIMGIEADFAQQVGEALNRKVVFVEVPFEKQIDYLEQNKTDIIMSNMTITGPRSIRVNFTTPYLQSGLSAMFIRGQHDSSGLIGSTVLNQSKRIGYIKGTTGEFYCLQRFTRGTLQGYKDTDAAIQAMLAGKVDMFVHDAPIIWWRSSMNERELVAFPEVLNVEPIAWAVARHNMQLLDEVNALIFKWERDGTSSKIVRNWLPNFGN